MITVRIPKATLHGFGSDIHAMLHTLETLKKAGIPALGNLGVVGVARGHLSMSDNGSVDEVVWSWNEADLADLEDLS